MKVILQDVCSPKTSNLAQKDLIGRDGDYPVYGASGYIGNINFYHQANKCVAVVKDGAGIGRTMLLPEKSTAIGTMQYLIPKENILPEYLFYAVKNMHLEKYYTGATIPHIYFKDYKNEKFNYVDLEQQLCIVNTLKLVEGIISKKTKQLEQLDNLVKSLFVEMFGDPVISSNGKKQVPFSEFIAYIRYGTSQPPVFSTNGEFKFIRATNIKKGKIIPKDMLRIDAIEANKIKKCQLTGNEIIIVRSGVNAGDTGIITSQYIGDYAGYDIIVSIDLKKGNPVYFNELINTHYMEQIIKPLTIRSAQPHLNAQQVKELPMVLATLEEQNNFAEVIEQIDKHKLLIID